MTVGKMNDTDSDTERDCLTRYHSVLSCDYQCICVSHEMRDHLDSIRVQEMMLYILDFNLVSLVD